MSEPRLAWRFRSHAFATLVAFALPFSAGAVDPVHVLPGTEVRLVLIDALSSQTAVKGQRFSLSVVQDVLVQGQVVIPRGTPAIGLVVRAEKNGSFGKPGVLQLRVQWLTLEGQRIPLFYSALTRGKDSDASAVVLTALFGPVGIMKHGKVVVVPAGTKLLAYVDQAFDATPGIPAGTIDAGIPSPASVIEPLPTQATHTSTQDGDIND